MGKIGLPVWGIGPRWGCTFQASQQTATLLIGKPLETVLKSSEEHEAASGPPPSSLTGTTDPNRPLPPALTAASNVDDEAPIDDGAASELLGRRHRVDGLLAFQEMADFGTGAQARSAHQAEERAERGEGTQDSLIHGKQRDAQGPK